MRWFVAFGVVACACGGTDKDASTDDVVDADTDVLTDTDDTDGAVDTDLADTDLVDSDTSAPMWDTDTGTGPVDTGPDPDLDGDGFPESADCDDQSPTIFPGALELCDGVDNDCDQSVDGLVATFFPASGAPSDLTAAMTGTVGAPGLATLRVAGELVVCPGTWLSRVSVTTDSVTVRALDDTAYTALDGSGGLVGAETVRLQGDHLLVQGLVMLNADGPIARVTSGSTDVRIEGSAMVGGLGGASAGGLTIEADASVTLVAGLVKTNTSTGSGGGVAVGSRATLVVDGTVFEANAADLGGAISVGSNGVVVLTDVVARRNTAFVRGGVLHLDGAGSVSVSHGVFNENNAAEGGVLWIGGTAATLSVDGSSQFRTSGGGAVRLDGVGSVTMTDVLFEDNGTAADGSAVWASGDTQLTVLRGLVRANTAGVHGTVRLEGGVASLESVVFRANLTDDGGALSVSGGAVTVTSCTFDANEASDKGGAIHLGGGTLSVSGGVWSRNVAGAGGGLFVEDGTATLSAVDVSAAPVDNRPNDIELPGGLDYSFDAATSKVCDVTACL